MHPIEEFEECVQFLHDLGVIFLDTKEKDIKQSLAGLFVEIMLPMAAVSSATGVIKVWFTDGQEC